MRLRRAKIHIQSPKTHTHTHTHTYTHTLHLAQNPCTVSPKTENYPSQEGVPLYMGGSGKGHIAHTHTQIHTHRGDMQTLSPLYITNAASVITKYFSLTHAYIHTLAQCHTQTNTNTHTHTHTHNLCSG